MRIPHGLLWICLMASGLARAESPQGFGFVRAGVMHGDDTPSWIDGGLGRYLAADRTQLDLEAQFALLWEPGLEWRWFAQALVRGESAGGGAHAGVVEAYGERTIFLDNDQSLRVRVGQFFLPTSREAVDPLWQSRYALGLSALNSWVAEEIRPIGVDVSWHSSADSDREWEWAATAFGGNDSSGALLAWRGFAQHDRLSVLGEVLPLPALPTLADGGAFADQRDAGSRPFGPDLDGRIGYALRTRFGDLQHFRLLVTWFDNRGDRGLYRGEYAWRTRFALLGGEWSPDARWRLAGEWMRGDSGMGFAPSPRVDIDFDTAYVLASLAPDDTWRFTARVESFTITDRDGVAENNDDHGRAFSLTVLRNFGTSWRLGLEWLHGDSRHAAASLLGRDDETGGNFWRIDLRRRF